MTRSTPTAAGRFASRMIPLTLAIGFLLSVVPPALFVALRYRELTTNGALHAERVVLELRNGTEQDPALWRYQALKLLRNAYSFVPEGEVAAVTLTPAGRDVPPALVIRAPGPPPATVPGRAVFRSPTGERYVVAALMRADGLLSTALALFLLFGLLGSAVAAVTLVWPVRVVRRSESRLRATLCALERSAQELAALNAGLEERIAARTTELRALSARMLELVESERRRVSRELHDRIGQALVAIQIDLQRAGGPTSSLRIELTESLDRALAEVRGLASDLRPPALDMLGLGAALSALLRDFELRSQTRVLLQAEDDLPVLAPEVSTACYRIVQEALTNVLKHAAASEVIVSLLGEDGELLVSVRDDGRGFDPHARGAANAGLGLVGMRERAELTQSSLEVVSAPGTGTLVALRVPLGNGRPS